VLTRLGKFEIIRLLATGSMGEVYVGRDPIIGREVAIKVIHPTASMGLDARERFAREARAAGVLNHPNIVTVHEMGEEQGVLYLAMELVKGDDLGTLIRAGTLVPRDVLEVLAQVCDGLAVAHRHRILHRDIKPSNIRVLWDGKSLQAKVLDFGVAKVINSDTTDEGTVFGTVNYMAPEYLHSGRPDARSDLFAVGVVLHEALAGVPPFDGPTPGSVIYRVLHDTPPPLPPTGLVGISRDVQLLLNHALTKDPSGRFQTAEEFAFALRCAMDPAWRWSQDRKAPPAKDPRVPPAMGGISQIPTPPQGIPGLRPPLHPAGPGIGRKGTGEITSKDASSPPKGRTEVRRDVLEATRRQLRRALELNPDNPKATAMLMVTLYRLGQMDALMQVLRRAQERKISSADLLAVERCEQMLREEEVACRLPLELHMQFLDYLGS
jgi:serine/threonine-protein kinase